MLNWESLDDQPQKYRNPGGMDARSADLDSMIWVRANRATKELATKMLQIQSKRFYLDVKQNRRRFIKVEIRTDETRSQVYLSTQYNIGILVLSIDDPFRDFYASLGPPNPENVPDDGKLKSKMIVKDNKRYYLNLKQNSRGLFLRMSYPVSQTITQGGPRTQYLCKMW